ncbi:ORF6N domain-containing protein [Candidatus Spongiihabitans sp.]|uniref:ORF6N domain-containing protein n=1 Tax=Candidatus Spongiihabitans sp. TaxID=3101308 RepID=UPI003C7D1CEC
MTSTPKKLAPAIQIERRILFIRGEKVILDADLAALYGTETRVLVQAVKRNIERFPTDFMFQLSQEEFDHLRSRIVTSSEDPAVLISQFVISKRGGRRSPPYAFTEQGVAMLSSVLRSKRAVQVNVEIMRTFVRLRQMLASNKKLAQQLNDLEQKYDAQFKIVFDVIHQLMAPTVAKKRPIGFIWNDKKN